VLGTSVMIGAGIFALTMQVPQMTGSLFPLAFLVAAIVVSFSAYSYIKIFNAYLSPLLNAAKHPETHALTTINANTISQREIL